MSIAKPASAIKPITKPVPKPVAAKAVPVKVTPVKARPKADPKNEEEFEEQPVRDARRLVAAKPEKSGKASRVQRAAKSESVTKSGSVIEDMDAYTSALAAEISAIFDIDVTYDQAKNKRTWFIKGVIPNNSQPYDMAVFITSNKGDHFRITLTREAFWSGCSRAYGSREAVIEFFTALEARGEKGAAAVAVKERKVKGEPEEE